MFSPVLLAAAKGFGLCAGFIVAIGSQNAFVLRQGLLRNSIGPVVTLCILADGVLITLGVFGFGHIIQAVPFLISLMSGAGALFLLWYGMLAAQRAYRNQSAMHLETTEQIATSRKHVLLTAAGFTFLNPHVYLDTVILLGSIAAHYNGIARIGFAVGAVMASTIWFTALGYGARLMAHIFERPLAWRIFDTVIAITMFAIATGLVKSLLT